MASLGRAGHAGGTVRPGADDPYAPPPTDRGEYRFDRVAGMRGVMPAPGRPGHTGGNARRGADDRGVAPPTDRGEHRLDLVAGMRGARHRAL
ncbi:hypothetical protein ACFU3E_27250 [Streptomyces sp. NPDC057424]|uniref:hypothetical protein n=1 Tax=Streptomyces sp. NPDC057424 TaxID=3346127 RepID=UPI0036B1591D